jgi:hypothetical protein
MTPEQSENPPGTQGSLLEPEFQLEVLELGLEVLVLGLGEEVGLGAELGV